MLKYLAIVFWCLIYLLCLIIIFNVLISISANVTSDTPQCKTLNTINLFYKDDSPETIKTKNTNEKFSEEINGTNLILTTTPINNTPYVEYYRFKNNKLYEYVLKINNPSVNSLDTLFKKSSNMCGTPNVILDDGYTTFTKQSDNGFYMTLTVVHPPVGDFVLIIYGYKKPHSKNDI